MQNLEKRIVALEQASPTDTETTMFIHLVGMGEIGKEIQTIASKWHREPGETEQDFKDRAERETTPSPTGCKVFLCSSTAREASVATNLKFFRQKAEFSL